MLDFKYLKCRFGANTVEESNGRRRLRSIAHRVEGSPVAPKRLNPPKPSLPPEELGADDALGDSPGRNFAKSRDQLDLTVGVNSPSDLGQNLLCHHTHLWASA